MRIEHTTTERLYVSDDEGAVIATLEVTKHPLLVNGYQVRLSLSQAMSEPTVYERHAATRPRVIDQVPS